MNPILRRLTAALAVSLVAIAPLPALGSDEAPVLEEPATNASERTDDDGPSDAYRSSIAAEHALQRRRMGWSLGGWAAANIVTGLVAWPLTDDPEWRAFHQMNVAWNGVNALLALSFRPSDGAPGPLTHQLRERLSLQTTLWFNAGLDVGYIATGFFLREFGSGREERAQGMGTSLVLQGAFLLGFDVIGALRSSRRNDELWNSLEVRVAPGSLRVDW